MLGGALSFIVVFRTNTAYSRWWEARMLWGAVNNNIRSVVCRATTMLKSDAAYTQMVTEFMAYAVLLKNHLRGVKTTPDELGGMLPFALIATLCESANPPLAAVQALAVTVRNGIKRVKRAHGHKVADIKLTVLSGSFFGYIVHP